MTLKKRGVVIKGTKGKWEVYGPYMYVQAKFE